MRSVVGENNPDAPGNFISWLCKKKDIYAYLVEGHRYDIGDMASYEEAKRLFGVNSMVTIKTANGIVKP